MTENNNLKKRTILVVDDEEGVLKSLEDLLRKEHFNVLTAATGLKAQTIALEKIPDLILLDLRLPDLSGYQVCQELKNNVSSRNIPIIFLSTKSELTDKVVGLEIGGDDYIAKPYNPIELLARVRAVLRRSPKKSMENESELLENGPLVLNKEARWVKVSDQKVKLTKKEFELLVVFMEKPGKVFSRRNLMALIWGDAYESLQSTVDSHIATIRKKLGEHGKLIETVPAVGYRLAEVE